LVGKGKYIPLFYTFSSPGQSWVVAGHFWGTATLRRKEYKRNKNIREGCLQVASLSLAWNFLPRLHLKDSSSATYAIRSCFGKPLPQPPAYKTPTPLPLISRQLRPKKHTPTPSLLTASALAVCILKGSCCCYRGWLTVSQAAFLT